MSPGGQFLMSLDRWCLSNATAGSAKGLGGVLGRAYEAPRTAGRVACARQRRALRELTRRRCAQRDRRARGAKWTAGPPDRGPQGSRRAAPTASSKRPRAPPSPFAASAHRVLRFDQQHSANVRSVPNQDIRRVEIALEHLYPARFVRRTNPTRDGPRWCAAVSVSPAWRSVRVHKASHRPGMHRAR